MSLILEALRKSEAERRRGEAPDLLSGPALIVRTAHPRFPRGRMWLAAALVLAVVAAPAAWWLLHDAAATSGDIAQVPVEATESKTASATVEATANSAEAIEANASRANVPAPLRSQAAAAKSNSAVETPSVQNTMQPLASSPSRPEPISAPQPNVVSQLSTSPTAPAPKITPIAPPPQLVAESGQASASLSMPQPEVDKPLSLAELPDEERQQLPPLKVDMHMWAEDPAQRFAIIDGKRVGEGDRLGNAAIAEITRDGVLLDWQGRRIAVPIR